MKKQRLSLVFALMLGIGLTLVLLRLMGHTSPAYANPDARYVASTGTDLANDCTVILTPCATVQHAVDVALDGDEILVAMGTYTDTHARPAPPGYTGTAVLTQVVFITKSLAIQGGYTTTNWNTPHPLTQATTLHAQGKGRVLFVTGTVTFTAEGLVLAGGSDAGLGGCPVDWGPEDCGSGFYAKNASVRLFSSIITRNASINPSVDNGGGIFFWSLGPGSLVSDSQVVSNTAGWGGGALLLESDDVTLIGNRISENQVITNGAGLNLTQSGATLIENSIFDNVAGADGGGLYLFRSTAVLTGNDVISNVASNNGGGLVLDGSPSILTGNSVSDNDAANRGGGLYLTNSDATLKGNTVSDNVASNNGGGLYLNNSAATLEGNTISDNTALNNGGGLNLSQSAAILRDNMVSGNDASTSGGGLNVSQSDATLYRNTVFSNTAYYGGGTYLFMGAPRVIGDIVSANVATVGGGLRLLSTTATLSNTVIVDNQAQGAGSGLNIYGSASRLLHTTIARNSGGGGSGIHVNNSSAVSLLNTILVSHTVGVTVTADSTATLEGVLWYGNALADTGGDGELNVSDAVTGPPAFAVDGYHLTLASAALDQGVEAGVATDIDDEARPSGNGPDLGADEIPGRLAPDRAKAVLPGGQWIYTHTLTNTANVSQSFALTISSSENYTVTVEPQTTGNLAAFDGSTPVTVTVEVPSDAISGTLDATVVTATGSLSGRDTATELTTVLFDQAAPLLTPDRATSVLADDVAVYTHTLTNVANGEQSYTLASSSSQGYTVTVEPETTGSLSALGGSTLITVTVQVPPSAISGTVDTTVVTATGSLGGQDVVRETTEILFNAAAPDFAPDHSRIVLPGEEVVYTHTLTNAANALQSYALASSSSQGYMVTVEPETTGSLSALGGSTPITVTVQVPSDAISGTVDTTVVTATGSLGGKKAVTDTTILFDHAVPILAPDRAGQIPPDSTITYTHVLTNSANAPLSFVLTADSSQGFTVTIEPGTTANLAALGGSAPITVTVQVPPEAISGTVDTTVVTATALGFPSLWGIVVDTTTVTAPPWRHIYLPVVMRQYP